MSDVIIRTVVYVDVGSRPLEKATIFLTEVAEAFKQFKQPGEHQIFIPKRDNGPTTVEHFVMPNDGTYGNSGYKF